MPAVSVSIEEFLALTRTAPVLDVRSPAEYAHAHIPGALSFPLFDNEERKLVGTAYKQESREKAIRIGLDMFGPKMRSMVEEAEKIAASSSSNVLLVHCWRGGMRSGAISWLLDLYGFKVYTLKGGYKRFRQYILDTFNQTGPVCLLGGYTGTGKTGLLQMLSEKGEMTIDLEDLASHKGSAFGNIGMPDQPGQEMFENLLGLQLRACEANVPGKTIWLEDESQRIGRLNIPKGLWNRMLRSPIYFLKVPFDQRLEKIVAEYGQLDRGKMIDAIGRISDKLGGLQAKNAVRLLEAGDIAASFSILLSYYDKMYDRAMQKRGPDHGKVTVVENPDELFSSR